MQIHLNDLDFITSPFCLKKGQRVYVTTDCINAPVPIGERKNDKPLEKASSSTNIG
ncbi:hypothetical protein KSX25_04475 [Acinetobacter baumannii]|nr:hypothetical protein [Acinetobacter baumannii]